MMGCFFNSQAGPYGLMMSIKAGYGEPFLSKKNNI